MSKNKRSSRPRHSHQPSAIEVEYGTPRIVAMSLAKELADAVKADPQERQELVDAALCVGQWLADHGVPGRWERVKPAEVLRAIDFLPAHERERFLFSLVGLLGHAAFNGQIQPGAARRSIDDIATLTHEDVIRTFARTTSIQLQAMTA
ncbi:MAG TPA: hypothetical protein VIM14_15645 [Polyangia bacterium]